MNKIKQGIIPSYILKELAEKGNEHAIKSLAITKDTHEKSSDNKKNENGIENNDNHHANIVKQPKRHVYDSQETEQKRRKIVRDEGDSSKNDDDVNRAYDFSGFTLKYLNDVLKRNSLDNKGMDLFFNVHFGYKFMNAVWDGSTNEMIFGDGDGKKFISFTRGIDVIAHEMGHGVTQFMNHLGYGGETGALNEHFSDVIGSAVKQKYFQQTADTADWLIGDKVVGPSWKGIALRSMKAPGTAYENDPQPDHIRNYVNLPISDRPEDDNGGVHINSGIPNKAFFLVSMEIGTDNAAVIWYNAWNDRTYLGINSKFKDAFNAIVKSARTLVEQGNIPSNAESVVKKAFNEVGITSIVSV
ncbi:peptidase M4 family protein [Bacillus thuringiensis]|uniref:M4 family metallopeptidase n=1 Tax=Bacillus thuringiensis TaxID=1428 RepID=UPI000BEC321A|nr:M4 family metallopeptidase [Bacillus thuringiensis]PEF06832.1 peptidase M4 family protein [Bacillus thuringiensis]